MLRDEKLPFACLYFQDAGHFVFQHLLSQASLTTAGKNMIINRYKI
jgi:hypothetical protein